MAKWVVVVSAEQYAQERLYGGGGLTVEGPAAGDEALLVTGGDEPVVFGLGRVDQDGRLQYTVNLLDSPLPAGGLARRTGRLDEASYLAIARQVTPAPARPRTYLVSVDLPIEASSPGEAVRAFWNYVRELGPAELPAFVWPAGDELAMQAYVLGVEANQDPEEE
ncbi:hypothetical protein Dvina_03865 [Dactylosporangium vinaceum]|uniref:DUF4265 domain-containing protein n=1 Tax=Dactylosporangium vinaceum TaxID=53362 RepID=A0ABV5M0M1_9ACTN|nr:hypothetical protein [Dactylosporangium vinaceum]UAB97327.1 hypothetical protein Dvina_03865 [Dactylosporangium vinaceum]